MAFELTYLLCFLVILPHLPLFSTAQPHQNISLGSSRTAGDDNSFWSSPSGDFAFGFQKIDGGFILAIWFNKIPEKTIVWSAYGEKLVQKGSTIELNADGQLLLHYPGESRLIDPDQPSGVAYAALLDTGNLVLANQNSINLWESFHHPTDTILPTQRLNQSSTLFARHTPTTYSKGRFLFILAANGTPAMYTTNFPKYSPNYPYWSLQTVGNFQVFFNQSGAIYLIDNEGTRGDDILPPTRQLLQDYYQRATLDFNGVLNHYIYAKVNGSGPWYQLRSQPQDICHAILETTGGGACGFNGLCENDEEGPSCKCADGYALIDPNDVLQGCRQNFTAQSCDAASPEGHLFDLKEMQNTDWPNGDYAHLQKVTEQECRDSCLDDCFCAIAIFFDLSGDCWKKGIPLSNGRMQIRAGYKSLVKFRIEINSTLGGAGVLAPCEIKKNNSAVTLIGSILMLIITLLVVSMTTYLVISHFYYRKSKVSKLSPVVQGIYLRCFTYVELKHATNGFNEQLGRGAFATVYKGVLASENGKFIAVKRLDSMVENDLEFKAEVSAIGGTNHKNLVKLLGLCNEGKHRILVYEFMTNGSLSSFLFGDSRPSWYQRRVIALGTARGLLYLHEECSNQIIHCDIKPQNILLDDSFTARIADFGVAKLLKTDQTRTTTRFRGTKGYVAPEWFKRMPVTVKVDVYSFGIVLLEIICCRKHYEPKLENEDQIILADWAYTCYKEKKLHLLLDNDDEEAKGDIRMVAKLLMIGFWCIQEDPAHRPTMKNVTQMLEGTVEVPVPPNPSSLYVQSK